MDEMISDNKVYTPSEVASCLRVSPVTISRSIRDGKLKAFRVGGQWRILGSQVVKYIESQTDRAMTVNPTRATMAVGEHPRTQAGAKPSSARTRRSRAT